MTTDWQVRLLGDVLKLEYGKPLPEEDRAENGAFPAYGANGVYCRTNKTYYDQPSIIVGRKGSAGELTLTEEKFWPLDVTYYVTFDERQYDLIFLYYVLSSLQVTKLAKGVKPGINRNDIYNIEFPFPSLREQKRIVAILDEAFAGIAAATTNAEKNLANARELFESYLDLAFSVEGSGWTERSIESLCRIGDGNHSSKYPKNSEMVARGVPFIRSTNLVKGTISSDDVLYISLEKHETLKKGHLKTGDVLFTNRGEIGKVAIVPKEFDGANLNSQIAWLRSSGEILPEYLYFFLQSSEMKRHFSQTRSGTALQQFTIKMLKEVAISYPIKDIQLEIVKNLKKLSLEIGSLEAVYQKKLATLAELKQTILQKAFSDELTALPGAEMQVEAA